MQGIKRPAKFIVMFVKGLEILDIREDKHLDVIVEYRWHGKISKSMLRIDEYGYRYFYAAKSRIYYQDLRKVA